MYRMWSPYGWYDKYFPEITENTSRLALKSYDLILLTYLYNPLAAELTRSKRLSGYNFFNT